MARLLGLTGTPGTGKKSVAPLVAKNQGVPCIGLNDLAESLGAISARSHEVDAVQLKKQIPGAVPDKALVYGHLLPYVLDRKSVDRVIVLRCDPLVLKARLLDRGYPPDKVRQNVEAELIGLVSADAFRVFGPSKTWELDTTGVRPGETASAALAILSGQGRRTPPIEWAPAYASGARLRSLLS